MFKDNISSADKTKREHAKAEIRKLKKDGKAIQAFALGLPENTD